MKIKSSILTAATLIMLAACEADNTAGTNGGDNSFAKLSPETAVGMSVKMPAFGNETTTRGATTLTSAQLAAIPADGEVTATTDLSKTPSTAGKAYAQITLYGAAENSDIALTADGNTVGAMAGTELYSNGGNTILNGDGILRLLHLNLTTTNTAGTSQPHSRLAQLDIIGSGKYTNGTTFMADRLLAVAKLGDNAEGTATETPQFAFNARHTGVKLSVLVQNASGADIAMSDTPSGSPAISLTSAAVTANLGTYATIVTDDGKNLNSYLTNTTSGDVYPDDPKISDLTTAIVTASSNNKDYPLKRPATAPEGITVPTNLLNGTIPACATHSLLSGVFTKLATSPARYTDEQALTLNLSVDGALATFTLKLKDIALTGLPTGDARLDDGIESTDGTGHLLYTNPGEHITLTLKVDARRDVISGTATIGSWGEADGGEYDMGDESKAPDLEYNADTQTYTVRTAEALTKLNTWLTTGEPTADGPVDDKGGKWTGSDKFAVNITLGADIALTVPTTEGGRNWTPIGNSSNRYTGTLDGGGHTLTGMTINSEGNYVGMISYLGSGGTVKNLALKNANVKGNAYIVYVGGIAGNNDGTITACSSAGGNVSATGGSAYAGGIAGNNVGTITACSSAGGNVSATGSNGYAGGIAGVNCRTITACWSTASVSGTYAGGIAGNNPSGTITACWSTAEVTGTYAGGIAGYNPSGTITACWSTAEVTGTYAGGIAGRNYATVNTCYTKNNKIVGSGTAAIDGKAGCTDDDINGTDAINAMNTAIGDATTYRWQQGTGSPALPTLFIP